MEIMIIILLQITLTRRTITIKKIGINIIIIKMK